MEDANKNTEHMIPTIFSMIDFMAVSVICEYMKNNEKMETMGT